MFAPSSFGMKHLSRLCLPPLLSALLVSGCDMPQRSNPPPQSAEEALADCVALGFIPDTWEMSRCLKADSGAQRLVLVDQATYGTF